MKRKIIALTAACSLAFGTLIIAQAQDPAEDGPSHHGKGRHGWAKPFEKLNEKLNLTDDQKVRVQPIIDQAKPQIAAIHKDAMQRTKAVMDNTMAQIRPLLTPEQQQKLDAMQKEHKEKLNARKAKHDVNQ